MSFANVKVVESTLGNRYMSARETGQGIGALLFQNSREPATT